MSFKKQALVKRKRSLSPEKTNSNELYFVYESKRRVLWSNLRYNENEVNSSDENQKNVTTTKLKSLFKICLTFVAKHIEYVESLFGFPSQVGHIIFKECVQVGRFSFNEASFSKEEHSLKLFAKAYPDSMANSLNLSSNPILFSYLSNVLKLCFLKRLDLSNCDLVTTCLNLNEILQSSLSVLEDLSLSNNNLDEDFIKKFTISQRLNITDFSQLASLDLTKNYKLQTTCLKYFCNYKNLNRILLSVDRLKEFESSIEDQFRVCFCKYNEYEIKTIGWLEEVVSTNMFHQIKSTAVKGMFIRHLKI